MSLTGKWTGQYSQNKGTKEVLDVVYHSFELEITDVEGELSGKSIDLTLENEPARINGFHEEGFISFIKKYKRLIFHDDEGNTFADEAYESFDIHYAGQYNPEEKAFQGTWEIQLSEEREGLQESYIEEYDSGDWFMRKMDD